MSTQMEHLLTTGDLISELAARAPKVGGNDGGWPGLTIYRFHEPTEPTWEEIQSLSIGIVAQGRKAVMVEGSRYVYDPFHYLVLSSHLHFQAQILEASPRKPFLSFVLQVDPALVKKVSTDMLDRRTAAGFPPVRMPNNPEKGLVSALDADLMCAVIRFLQSLSTGADRRVLSPMHLQEIVYRVLQREQFSRLLYIAAKQSGANPISAALTFVREHFSEPITVNDMAEQVSLSPSSFSHLFREVTGRPPYQFLKEIRLDRARELLIEGRLSVTDVSRAVGYSSASHFIKEFRSRFGTTPRAYVDAQSLGEQLQSARTQPE
ncbi:AraC family transcriptional regulator [Amycolatopsis sp. EV170708-02-1]|uniref:AraC family transcriptional regulator n=1 Tax=Amycolatopsis sp. EV170708-02-1 TaxID=2919322 RepID=UPI001F0CA0A4|nr:AraC family transcriptional regulator [Amycolatopsis sp. EV170708-02-1]UMP07059.1 AraC family transcriptional regulator [Amycolatopsis sp. EV170708-02-1]